MLKLPTLIFGFLVLLMSLDTFAASETTLAPSGFRDASGQVLKISAPLSFYIDSQTVPQNLWESIIKAANEANQELGEAKILIDGNVITGRTEQDGINAIAFSDGFLDGEQGERSKQQAYWGQGQIHEIDILVNSKNFDFTKNPQDLTATLKVQFKKIFGR